MERDEGEALVERHTDQASTRGIWLIHTPTCPVANRYSTTEYSATSDEILLFGHADAVTIVTVFTRQP